jgi:hypothetical protein
MQDRTRLAPLPPSREAAPVEWGVAAGLVPYAEAVDFMEARADIASGRASRHVMRRSALGAFLGLAAMAWAPATLAGPAVSTRWNNVRMSQDQCLRKAEDAIRQAGFGRLERTEQSRYGTRGDYTAAVRCVSENNIVFFIASGPSRGEADQLAGAPYDNF